ncbi:GFA family protein [Kaarinaea lacus]
MNNNLPAEGGCACGKVRYRLLVKPMFVHCCHCTWCQRETGSAFAINALIEAHQIEILKDNLEKIVTPTTGEEPQDIYRCKDCKVALWSQYGVIGSAVSFVRVGTLDNPNQCPPAIHIFTSTKQDWVILPADVPAVEEYYRRSKYWPTECVIRYKTALGKL